jgi:RNA polymerase sigma factor (sigma-70 family)
MIDGLRREDSTAVEHFYCRYGPLIKGICFRYAQNHQQAEDLFHDLFFGLFEKVKKYRKIGSFDGWLKTVTVNAVIDHLNHSKRERQQLEESASAYYEDLAEGGEPLDFSRLDLSEAELITMINRLPQGFRIVFNLHVIDGYAHTDIAQMLKISESTSRSQLARAKTLLRRTIDEKIKIIQRGEETR